MTRDLNPPSRALGVSPMTLRRKTLLIFGLTLISLIGVL